MSAADLAEDDLSLAALLFEAGKQDLVPSEVVMDVLLEALKSDRPIEEVVSDRDVLSRRQRETLIQFVERQHSKSLPKRSTVDDRHANTAADRRDPYSSSDRPSSPTDQFEADCHALLPTGFDRYDPEQEIGRGGWGVVYRAHDQQLDRTVAVKKMIDDGRTDRDSVRRFLHEASITAQLQHPGIVPVYERGLSLDDRRPFYSMKLLHGSTLRDRIRDYHQLSAASDRRQAFHRLLRAFVDVCDAVGFAHSRHIIHRDLKPSNVIVGEFGETVVVDWGLATRLDPATASPEEQAAEQTLAAGTPRGPVAAPPVDQLDGLLQTAVTRDGTVIGTPAFMSPEQAAGKSHLDQRSDVYALGSVLYVLLTGKPAFHADTVDETLVTVTEGNFAHPRSVNRRIPAALASICCKAMAREREDRYADAAQLGAEVSRFLTNEPVQAHRDSALEKVARWCRRRPVLAVTTLLGSTLTTVLTTIAALLILEARNAEAEAKQSAVSALHAEQEARTIAESARSAAQQRLTQARTAADQWLIGLSGTLQHYPGLETVRADLIQQAITHYESLLDTSVDKAEAPLERIRNQLRLADLFLLQSQADQASALFMSARQAADRLTASDAPIDELAAERLNGVVGSTLCSLRTGQFSRKTQKQLATALQKAPLAVHPDSLELQNSAARGHLIMARGHVVNRAYRAAAESFETALQLADRCNVLQPNERSRRLLRTIRAELATIYSSKQRHDDAARLLQDQIKAVDDVLQQQSERPDLLETRALTQMRWANEQRRLGQVWVAERGYRNAVNDLSNAWNLLFGDRFYNENLAIAQANLGQLSLKLNRPADAEPMLRSAVDQLTGVLQSGIGDRETASRLAACNVSLGQVLVLQGDPAAEEQIQRSLQIFDYLDRNEQMSETDRLTRGQAMKNLGRWYRVNQNLPMAVQQLQAAVDYLTTLPGRMAGRDRLLAETELDLADALAKSQGPDAAQQHRNRAIDLLTSLAETESARGAAQDGSATLRLVQVLLDDPEAPDDRAAAVQRLQEITTAPDGGAQHLQLHAIAELRQQQYRSGLATIRSAMGRRRFPDPVDQAVEGCLLLHLGRRAEAELRQSSVRTAAEQQPGRLLLQQWSAALTECLRSDENSGQPSAAPD